jgi:hypothetical protein
VERAKAASELVSGSPESRMHARAELAQARRPYRIALQAFNALVHSTPLVLSAALVCAAVFLLFWRLDGALLWRDEADTAVLARAMVTHHDLVPRYLEGSEFLAHEPDSSDFNSRFEPALEGWLQYYAAAAAFRIFGVSTWTARFPFAVLGLLALAVMCLIGRGLFGPGPISLLPPSFALFSIQFLSIFRECRYYALVYLLALLVIYEVLRTGVQHGEFAEEPVSFRLLPWGMLLYFSHSLTFGGIWLAVAMFLVIRRDWPSMRRFVLMSAIAGAVIVTECVIVERFGHVPRWSSDAGWGWILRRQAKTIFGAVPAILLACALAALLRRRGLSRPFTFTMQLCLTLGAVPAAVSILLTRQNAGPHYYVSILPTAAILSSLIAVTLWKQYGFKIAVPAALAFLVWPNLGFYIEWNERIVERQLLRIHSFDDALIDVLRHNTHPGQSVLVHRNMEGQVIHFYLPDLHWVGLIEGTGPDAARLRTKLPAWCFDDRVSTDWLVIWHPIWERQQTWPPSLDARYAKIWDYSFYHPLSVWDTLVYAMRGNSRPLERYIVYRRVLSQARGPMETRRGNERQHRRA